MEELRREMASLAIPDAGKDELIRIVDNIVISFVDQAHGLHPVQLSLAARANKHFRNDGKCGNRNDAPAHSSDLSAPWEETTDSDLNKRLEP
jgi:hypothetical protein